MSTILITGATGQLGAAVADALLKKTNAANLKVLVRDKAKAAVLQKKGVKIAEGDYNDYDSLVAAFTGADKIYFVSGNDLPTRGEQHSNVVKAAIQAGVKHVVYTSTQRKNETGTSPIAFVAQSHLSTEQALKESGLTYTILQHTLYEDLIPLWAGPQVLDNKTIYFPAGEGKAAFALRTDMAEAAAIILLDESEKYHNKAIEISGAEAVSWQQIADDISAITGQPISYVSPSAEEFTAALQQAGVPEEIIQMSAGFAKAIEEGEFSNVNPALEEILGRKPVTVKAYLQGVYGK
ncbi:SDR family oxidoreductase [Mucilaginibacter sp.]